jgi:nitroreductase
LSIFSGIFLPETLDFCQWAWLACFFVDIREALYTTRAMRRVLPDPIPEETQMRILDAAIRAPSGGNTQSWHFLVVDSLDVKKRLGPLYRDGVASLWETTYAERIEEATRSPESQAGGEFLRMKSSIQHLADHFEEVPLFLFAFGSDTSGRSILPAVWSAQLAARAEGIGSSLSSILNHFCLDETLRILGVPEGSAWHLAACVAFGFPSGRWGVAKRRPVQEVASRNRMGNPIGFRVDAPLWPEPLDFRS